MVMGQGRAGRSKVQLRWSRIDPSGAQGLAKRYVPFDVPGLDCGAIPKVTPCGLAACIASWHVHANWVVVATLDLGPGAARAGREDEGGLTDRPRAPRRRRGTIRGTAAPVIPAERGAAEQSPVPSVQLAQAVQ